jgi:diguanylate cyclase (GGDEF)-like protein
MKDGTTQIAKAALLGDIDIFSGLAEADLKAISTKMKRRSFKSGTAVFRENEEGEELFVVADGLVAITIRSQDAEDIELSRVGRGGFFGEMSLLERAPRSATCTAVEPTECFVLAATDFDALMMEYPSAAMGVLKRMLEIAAGRLLKTGAFLSQMVQWGDSARKRAVTDAATGLFNRRYLEDSFESIVARAKREGTELSFAMFDLDRFGKLNATYGAEFCDNIILDIAAAFRRVFGEEDILVRYGGDEFCFVILRPAEEALKKCEEVCAAVRTIEFASHPDLRISCSIGVAAFPGSASGTEQLKERADKALYQAKESGRDRAVAWKRPEDEPKRAIATIKEKNRIMSNIVAALDARDKFLIIGHKDPDEDCVASMVAFALLAVKLNKKAVVAFGGPVQDNFEYLVNICRYNSIDIVQDGPLPACSTLVLMDTPKPSMIDRVERYAALREDPAILKIEFDHHLEADSRYYGDPDYRLVYEASSTCEIISFLAIKLSKNEELMTKYQITELMSRNLVLAILTGMIGDSRMGRYLKTHRERWFYARFSALFEQMLANKTHMGSKNFSNKEQVFTALVALSHDEEACFRFIVDRTERIGRVNFAVLDVDASRELFAVFGNDTVVAVSRAVVDKLAEESGYLGFVGYYDDPALSTFVQFRLRRSQAFTTLDLREAIARMGITNGGGHPGAVGFRLERDAVANIVASARGYAAVLDGMLEETAGQAVGESKTQA